jgi:hypothetical protein
MATVHISGMGDLPSEEILKRTDKVLNKENGIINLSPHFKEDYYGQL